MLGKRRFIGKLSDLLIPGGRAGLHPELAAAAGSPRTPLDLKLQSPRSPRGPRGYDLGGVGLGIVAALERSGEVPGRHCVCSPRGASAAAAAAGGKGKRGCAGFVGGGGGVFDGVEMDCQENYTYVTCHGPGRSFTKVYYDGGLDCPGERERSCPAAAADDYGVSREPASRVAREGGEAENVPVYPFLDFLSSCHWCPKKLDGVDIYMYRGEKAFCSADCRSKQIKADEQKERTERTERKCRNEASKAADLSSSPYTKGRIFSTGIEAL